jgi:hypothetical protein
MLGVAVILIKPQPTRQKQLKRRRDNGGSVFTAHFPSRFERI